MPRKTAALIAVKRVHTLAWALHPRHSGGFNADIYLPEWLAKHTR